MDLFLYLTYSFFQKWVNVYHLSIMFMQSMLDSLSHDFLDNALDFIGVHHDRIGQVTCNN